MCLSGIWARVDHDIEKSVTREDDHQLHLCQFVKKRMIRKVYLCKTNGKVRTNPFTFPYDWNLISDRTFSVDYVDYNFKSVCIQKSIDFIIFFLKSVLVPLFIAKNVIKLMIEH